ncbi:MAG: hypothetical protein U0Q21_10200 [Dermatophilaceae bacterium]
MGTFTFALSGFGHTTVGSTHDGGSCTNAGVVHATPDSRTGGSP